MLEHLRGNYDVEAILRKHFVQSMRVQNSVDARPGNHVYANVRLNSLEKRTYRTVDVPRAHLEHVIFPDTQTVFVYLLGDPFHYADMHVSPILRRVARRLM